MLPPHILVLGSINTDLVVRGPRLPKPGETVVGGSFFQAGGGKGANQAVAAARAGAAVTMIGAIGDDAFGRHAIDRLARDGVNTSHIRIVPNSSSGIALILVDEQGENMIGVAPGANHRLTPEDLAAIPDELFTAHRVLLASLEVPLPTVTAALARAKKLGLTTILNPAPATPDVAQRVILNLVDVLTPNRGEAALLTGNQEAAQAARLLCDLGPEACVITLGREGCLVAEKNAAPRHLPAAQVSPIDTTGAGDTFCGVLAVGLSEGLPIIEAARFATAAAAITVTRLGPSPPTRKEIESFLTAKT